MFKKLKDKLAEEVKSSPQRIQQFAQAAQAAVTSASSSISDITNSDLFSIGDNENHNLQSNSGVVQPSGNSNSSAFQDVSLKQSQLENNTDFMDYATNHNIIESQRQRRLSNSSFASDVSFRLPNYESPSMYHLQSDMEVSASEAEDRNLSGGSVSLDRVTKEQLYAVYRRTQERYKKYRSQYGDLARHYKLLERENAKAKSVLVETQDKALRRISELKEQCGLEQSAKAHLEKSLRIEIEEQSMKIGALNTKIKLLQECNEKTSDSSFQSSDSRTWTENVNNEQLIDLSSNDRKPQPDLEAPKMEITNLNNKLEKMEQLLNKYKESLKANKDKNTQLTTELQMALNEIENKNKEIEVLKVNNVHLTEAKEKIQELNEINENLQNTINSCEFTKGKELSVLKVDLQKAQNEISELRGKIEVFTKREEEYAISLAENKLSIHKELESKEKEIKSLKDSLSSSQKEIQSLSIIVSDYKNCITSLEDEKSRLNNEISELNSAKNNIAQLQLQVQDLSQKCNSIEQSKTKLDEEYQCLQLQMKQETAEKLAIIDRNDYLNKRNAQLGEEIEKKNSQISVLENTLQTLKKNESIAFEYEEQLSSEKSKMTAEIDNWKSKCKSLETEISDERVELVKLQSEIENLLANHERTQIQNSDLNAVITDLKLEISNLQHDAVNYQKLKKTHSDLQNRTTDFKKTIKHINHEINMLKKDANEIIMNFEKELNSQCKLVLDNFKNLCTGDNVSKNTLEEVSKENNIISQNLKALQEENNQLNSKLNECIADNDMCKKTMNEITAKYDISMKEFNDLKTEYKILTEEKNNLSQKWKILQEENNQLNSKLNEYIADNHLCKNTINEISGKYDISIKEFNNLKTEHKISSEEKSIISQNLTMLQEENKKLNSKLNEFIADNDSCKETINEISAKYDINMKEFNDLNTKHKMSLEKIELLEKEYNSLQEKNENNSLQFETENQNLIKKIETMQDSERSLVEKTLALETINQDLIQKIKDFENKNSLLIYELDEIKNERETTQRQLFNIKKQHDDLLSIMQKSDDNKNDLKALEEEIKALQEENLSLISASENGADEIKTLTTKLKKVQESEAKLELENNLLNSTIEQLISQQNTGHKKEKNEKLQTNDFITQEQANTLTAKPELIFKQEQNVDLSDLKSVEQEYFSKTKYDTLRDENKRLHSDIEGLQTYLRKISKENSLLNDKLRELIANSENSEVQLGHVTNMESEVKALQEKLDHLSRENTFLVEENLELKDQLQSQNFDLNKTTDYENEELISLKARYDSLYTSKKEIDQKCNNLETTNYSITKNMQEMQTSNEKYKLSNEKLSRRLDEALVSLRHIHSLQENTELEYLKNILYEYLTGSGAHSVTLAKVLSAIVKFDDMQTQIVLQKEKERQGLLRQLGLM